VTGGGVGEPGQAGRHVPVQIGAEVAHPEQEPQGEMQGRYTALLDPALDIPPGRRPRATE